VQGSFTGATRDRAGRIATAHRGTLFLDEVAEITPEVQVKLLRFLECGEIQRVGSDRVEKVDARIVAATHQDLPALIEQGRFRRDLYHRLKVIELELPPLRERASDIPLLVDCLLRKHWKRGGERPRFSPDAEHALMAYDYPGNVRELAHLVERACILSTSPELGIDLLPPELRAAPPAPVFTPGQFRDLTKAELEAAREAALYEVEAVFLRELMQRHGGNVSLAARASGIHRSQLQKLLAEHRSAGGPSGRDLTDAKERLAG
jgi:Nif-specific regulatory protein/two-component system response regulator HydG